MLERLVQRDLEPTAPELRRLDLAHRGVNRILITPVRAAFAPRIDEQKLGSERQGRRESGVRFDWAKVAGLDATDGGDRHARLLGESSLRPAAPKPLVSNGAGQLHAKASRVTVGNV